MKMFIAHQENIYDHDPRVRILWLFLMHPFR